MHLLIIGKSRNCLHPADTISNVRSFGENLRKNLKIEKLKYETRIFAQSRQCRWFSSSLFFLFYVKHLLSWNIADSKYYPSYITVETTSFSFSRYFSLFICNFRETRNYCQWMCKVYRLNLIKSQKYKKLFPSQIIRWQTSLV